MKGREEFMMETRFIQPLDVLYLRGNQLFDGAGAYSAPLMPPWPSLAAGAIRSRMLSDHGVDMDAYSKGKALLDEPLNSILGSPETPGAFSLHHFGLARRVQSGSPKQIHHQPIYPLPADLIASEEGEAVVLHQLKSSPLPGGIRGSNPLTEAALLQVERQIKPLGDCWLTLEGMRRWITGNLPSADQLLRSSDLWASDPRLGIALNPQSRTTQEGQLYTVDSIAMREGVGFIATVGGANEVVPNSGLLRFGGDGRGAEIVDCKIDWPQPDWQKIEEEQYFRLLLTSPGIFPQGWQLPGQDQQHRLQLSGVEVQIKSATVSRSGVVSGWDLARWQPKAAQRVVATGAVYTLKLLEGGVDVLQKWVNDGLPIEDSQRRAEGFNRVLIANVVG